MRGYIKLYCDKTVMQKNHVKNLSMILFFWVDNNFGLHGGAGGVGLEWVLHRAALQILLWVSGNGLLSVIDSLTVLVKFTSDPESNSESNS